MMDSTRLRRLLDDAASGRAWLAERGVAHPERGHANLVSIASQGVPLDLLAVLVERLGGLLPRSPDPGMSLNNLDRFIARCRSPLTMAARIERDRRALEILVQLFGTSQYFSDLLISDPEAFDELYAGSLPQSAAAMLDELWAEVEPLEDPREVGAALRRFRQRHILRIGYDDIIRGLPLGVVVSQISHVADVVVEVALRAVRRRLEERHGVPRLPDGKPCGFVVLALGKLGGEELNYSSDIDLIFLYEDEGQTEGRRPLTHQEFFARLGADLVKLITDYTELGQCYRVDLRLRPEGHRGPLARSVPSALAYYDVLGRTWERQALIKARPIAGDLALGEQFLRELQPWIFRRYLNFAEISGIQALKRRIESRTGKRGEELIDVKTGYGGIRDVEFVTQFLQLLHGGAAPKCRSRQTLTALAELADVGCLTHQEHQILDDTYRLLRKVEHRLQTMFDLQTHRLPDDPHEIHKLALRMGYDGASAPSASMRAPSFSMGERRVGVVTAWAGFPPPHPSPTLAEGVPASQAGPTQAFLADYCRKTELNRRILDHILHDAFPGEPGTPVEPEVDLVLHPDPPWEMVRDVLGRYPFKDPAAAYENLVSLSRESVPFLSTPRCRHFLAAIAPRLLRAVAATSDPDLALVNLEKVSDSLGGKGVLWELFQFHPPSLKLYVDLCASSPFLVEILVNNPGMIDQLIDSLVLDQPKSLEQLRNELDELCRHAEDPEPILHSFKNQELLRIGVRDILGKDDVQSTNQALTDLAEAIFGRVVEIELTRCEERWGVPSVRVEGRESSVETRQPSARVSGGVQPRRSGPAPSRLAILALGKFGGRELGYHSDLDVVFLYEADGETLPPNRYREGTTNFHFYSEAARGIIRALGRVGPYGTLYEVDARLRPTGGSGALVIPLDEFRRYYREGGAQLWERQALTRARPLAAKGTDRSCAKPSPRALWGDPEFCATAMRAVEEAAYTQWKPEMAAEILAMRRRMQASRGEGDLKRGFGGIVDVEFLVQMLMLKHGRERPAVRTPNTLQALDALHTEGILDAEHYGTLRHAYQFLRQVESRLRIVHGLSRNELPDDPLELDKLARRLGYEYGNDRSASDAFLEEYERVTAATRRTFLALFQREGAGALGR